MQHWTSSLKAHELEANRFAAEILMPRSRVDPLVSMHPSFLAIEQLARQHGTSLTASGFRYAQLSPQRVAFVWSHSGAVRWAVESPDLGLRIRKGELSGETLAASLHAGDASNETTRHVRIVAWADGADDDTELHEHSRRLPHYSAVVSLLHFPDLEDPPSVEELDPEEFTLHRRHWRGRR